VSDANPSGLIFLTEMMQLGHKVTEDCLTLNVWTKPQTGDKAKNVMVWIYGGGERHSIFPRSWTNIHSGFATGNSANAIYDGQHLADLEDVVLVSFKYVISH
jgi:cholinesterase